MTLFLVFPHLLSGVFLAVPLWIFFVPLLVLTVLGVRFRHRPRIRTACAAIALATAILAIPFVAVQGYYRMQADERLESEFGVPIAPAIVARYRFEPGFLDSLEYWKLRNVDPNMCRQIIAKNNLTEASSGSTHNGPSWWPKSSSGYLVFQGEDRHGGGKEIWISTAGSVTYLLCLLQ
jgi:hypothetical protein